MASYEPELLAPAGNWDCAKAAVASGADAIFFGLPKFNARLRADNFTQEDLPKLMEYLHSHGVQGFVTMNTLIFTDELRAAEKQLRYLEECGVDAIIVQDLGLAHIANQITPDIELHASTQMTITAPEGLRFVETLFPLTRAVLSRELSIQEIGRFQKESAGTKHTPLEVFVHGALCVAYSGQCLTSESLGQRSANRGECAQACRMPYELFVDGEKKELGEVRYLLSPQDLAAVDLIPQLIEQKVKSFKIEGRLKSPEYVAAVTSVYRKAIDAALENTSSPVTKEDRYKLEMTFSRGLSTGWMAGTNHPYLTHGRYGKKRGALLGEVVKAGKGYVDVHYVDREMPAKAGDGVVFDAGEDRNKEQGARLWNVHGKRLIFSKKSGIDWDRVQVGQKVWKTSDPALENDIRKSWQNAKPKQKQQEVDLHISGAVGSSLMAKATYLGHDITLESKEPLQASEKRPLTEDILYTQFSKLGDTAYQLGNFSTVLEGDCFLAVSAINRMRRSLVERLDQIESDDEKPKTTTKANITLKELLPQRPDELATGASKLSVLCRSLEQLEACISADLKHVYCDFEDIRLYKEAVQRFKRYSKTRAKIILATPRIQKPGEAGYFKLIDRAEADGVLIRNLGAIDHFKERDDLVKVGDFSLNIANPVTAMLLKKEAQLDQLTVSYDLNIRQVLNLLESTNTNWFELTLHQHMPMFHMEHCVFCTFMSEGTSYKDCGRPCEKHQVQLKDRVGQLHTLHADVGCRNTLFNGRAQTGANYYESLKATGLQSYRLELLNENTKEARNLIKNYQALLNGDRDASNLIRRLGAIEKLGVTEGTLKEV